MVIVKVDKVHKIYKTGKIEFEALKGIDLEIKKGEFIALAGPSGSGKTTLLNLIGCLDRPTQGRVYLEDEEISSLSASKLTDIRRKKIGFIFQTFNLIPVLSAYENIEFPLLLQKSSSSSRRKKVLQVAEEIGLTDVIHHRPAELSGGQQQRVAIARTLVIDPLIILADEPTANLDSHTGEIIIELMQRFNRDKNTTFLFSTHDTMIMDHASRVVKIHDGNLGG
ncbi:MAG: ABC transporter ATP-binding protein [Nitrospirota bacterium]